MLNYVFFFKLIIAILIPILAAGIQWLLWTNLPPLTWLLLYPAVFFSASISGLIGGVIATMIATLLGSYLFIEPQLSLEIHNLRHIYAIVIFFSMGILFSLFFEKFHQSKAELSRISNLDLEINQKRLNHALEVANAGIWEWDVNSNKNYWSDGIWKLYGLDAQKLQPCFESWLLSVHTDYKEKAETCVQQAFLNQNEIILEWPTRYLINEQPRWLYARGKPEFNNKGELVLYRGVVMDISIQKAAEDSLRKSQSQLVSFIKNAPVSMAMFDRNMDYLSTSNRWQNEYGRDYGSLIGLNVYKAHPNLPEKWKNVHQQVLSGKFLKNDEDFWIQENGQKIWLRWSAVPWNNEKGEIGGIIISTEDITDRKVYEIKLAEKTEKLLEADRQKNVFLAMLGHELRNPLAPIRNAVEIMKIGNLETSRLNLCTDIINRQLEHMTRLVDDLLDVSRISRNLIELKIEMVEVCEFIERAIETTQPIIDAHQHEFILSLPPEPLWVRGDVIRLAQIISNLLNNAFKYTPIGGQIRLSVASVDNEVCIRVTDNGCGVDASDLPKLFDLFYQADCNLDRSQGGIGVGLSLVKSLVEKHGGTVQAFSAGLGHGCEVVIHLPQIMLHHKALDSIPKAVQATPKKLNILVVDDNYDSAQTLSMLLEIDGHQVQTANDGFSALEIAKTELPEVIVLDIGLPVMNGFQVAQELRRIDALDKTLLIALTGYVSPEDVEKSQAAGFNAHLPKPLEFKALRKLLASHIDRV